LATVLTLAVGIGSADVAHAQSVAPAPSALSSERAIIERFCKAGPAHARAIALRAEGEAAVDMASVFPNPDVSVEHNRSLTGEQDTETIAGIGFPLGIGGRRFLLSDAADERASEKNSEADAVMVDGALDLREALVRVAAERERAAILARQQESLAELETMLKTLQKGGESSEHDVLRHALEVEVHGSRLALQRSRVASAQARLGVFTDRDVDLSGIALASIATTSRDKTSKPHPRLAALEASTRAAEIEEDAANRRWVPDLELFFGYRQVTMNVSPSEAEIGHGFALRVGLPLTFFDHGQGEASVARAHAAASRAAHDALVRTNRAEEKAADDAIASLDAPRAGKEDAETRARKLFDQAKRLYLAGEGSITDLLASSGLVESSALAAVDIEEARALARIAKMRAAGSLMNRDLDAICSARRP
jgi:outer membrane protein TolC